MRRWLATLIMIGCVSSAFAKETTENKKVTEKERSEASQRAADQPKTQTLGKDVAGVFVNASAVNTGYSPSFVMRGFPSALPLFDGASHGFAAQSVNLSTIDHVEFYKGPSAMLFGKALGGYGGAANYIRKTPAAERFLRASATAGGFGVGRLTVDANAPLNETGSLLFRLTGAAQTRGSFVDYVRARSYNIAPAISLITENGDRITLRAEHNASRLVYWDGVPAAPIFFRVPREFYAGAPVNENESPFYTDLTLTHERSVNKDWRITTVVDYYLFASRWGWFTGWGFDRPRAVTLGNPVRTREAVRNFDAQIRLNGRFETGPFQHTVFLGLEHWDYFFGHSDDFARYRLAPIDISYPVYPVGISYSGAKWANGVARAWSQSVYAQDLVDLNENWRILIGGRYDLLAQRERVFDPFGALSGESSATLSKGQRGYFSPRAGLLFAPDVDTQLFLAFGQSLIPNISSRLKNGAAPAPQQDTQYEIGFRQAYFERRLTFELGLFDITRNHVAIPDPTNPSGFYSLVTGQQHSHGIEVNLGMEPVHNLKVNAVATFLHAVVSKDSNTPSQQGSDLLGAPRRVYSINANYTFDAGELKGLELGATYYYASRAEATLPNTYGFTLPPQQMLGASLGYALTDNLKIDVSLTNLTNQPNWTSNGAMFHGEPRSMSASLSYKY